MFRKVTFSTWAISNCFPFSSQENLNKTCFEIIKYKTCSQIKSFKDPCIPSICNRPKLNYYDKGEKECTHTKKGVAQMNTFKIMELGQPFHFTDEKTKSREVKWLAKIYIQTNLKQVMLLFFHIIQNLISQVKKVLERQLINLWGSFEVNTKIIPKRSTSFRFIVFW